MRQTLTKTATALSTISVQSSVLSSKSDFTPKGKLVAQWLRDEHSKLYCQWVSE